MKMKKLSLQKDTLLPLDAAATANIAGGLPVSSAIPLQAGYNACQEPTNLCTNNCTGACATQGQATCATCGQATCATCNQATCNTCATNCGCSAATCRTDCICPSMAIRASCYC